LEGEAALGLVELHRGDADVERHAVDRLHTVVGKRLTHPAETLRNQRQAPPARGRQSLAGSNRVRIAIEGEYTGRALVEDLLGIAAGAEGAVDMGLAGGDGEAVRDLVEKHRLVGRRGEVHAPSPRSSSL